jgi:hypothetical protein
MQLSILGASTAMERAKIRKWTDERAAEGGVPAMARELGRHIASLRRLARELGLLLPQGRGEGPLSGGS